MVRAQRAVRLLALFAAAMIALFAVGLLRPAAAQAATTYTDTDPEAWYMKDGWVDYVTEHGLMTGRTEGVLFVPEGQVTRAEFATVLWRIAGSPQVSDEPHFPDTKGHWATKSIAWATKTGVITGYLGGENTGKFLPDAPITRAEMATMLYRYADEIANLDVSNPDETNFNKLADADSLSSGPNVYARDAAVWAASVGLITGNEHAGSAPTLDADDFATRADAAKVFTVLHRDVLPGKPAPVATHTVTFDSNGGSAVASQKVEDGKAVSKPADPARDGYKFAGWQLDGKAYDFSAPVKADITLKAAWDKQEQPVATHTVTFDSNGGSAVASQKVEDGKAVSKPADPTWAEQTKEHTFAGWYSDKELTKAYDFAAPVTADVTLYAKWNVATYKVQFMNGDEVFKSYDLERGAKIPNPGTPARDGYKFTGWSPVFTEGDVVEGNATYSAQWKDTAGDDFAYVIVDKQLDAQGNERPTDGSYYISGQRVEYYGAGAYITGYRGKSDKVSVPAQIAGKPVVYVSMPYADIAPLGQGVKLTSVDLSATNATLRFVDLSNNAELTGTGFVGFTALVSANVSDTAFTEMNLDGTDALQTLLANNTKIAGLDLSGKSALTQVSVNASELTTLTFKGNAALTSLSAADNGLTIADLTQAPGLEEAFLQNNALTAIDLSKSAALTNLNVEGNQLTALSIPDGSELKNLYLAGNKINKTDVAEIEAWKAESGCFVDGLEEQANAGSLAPLNVNARDVMLAVTGEPVEFPFEAPEGVDPQSFTLTYADAEGNVSDEAPTEPGTYTVTLSRAADDTYEAFEHTYTMTLTAQDAAPAFDYIIVTGTVDGSNPEYGTVGVNVSYVDAKGEKDTTWTRWWGEGAYITSFDESYDGKDVVIPATLGGSAVVSAQLSGNADLDWGVKRDSVDATQATSLRYLDVNDQGISSLDVTGLAELQYLDVHMNNLTALDLTTNPLLTQDSVTVDQGVRVTYAATAAEELAPVEPVVESEADATPTEAVPAVSETPASDGAETTTVSEPEVPATEATTPEVSEPEAAEPQAPTTEATEPETAGQLTQSEESSQADSGSAADAPESVSTDEDAAPANDDLAA